MKFGRNEMQTTELNGKKTSFHRQQPILCFTFARKRVRNDARGYDLPGDKFNNLKANSDIASYVDLGCWSSGMILALG